VIDGIDLLGSDEPLHFDWDLDGFLNRDADAPVQAPAANPVLEDFQYLYSPPQFVLVQPLPDADEDFWIGRLEASGGPGRRGEYELWWMAPFNPNKPYDTTWRLARSNGQPFLDWQFQEGIQDAVVMIANGGKISAKSKKTIRSFVRRWRQALGHGDDANGQFPVIDGDEDMDIPANEAGMN
jgi:hypothetical protein